MPTAAAKSTLPAPGDAQGWFEVGSRLRVADGVHRPSRFSAALAANLPDLTGASVADLGCGAGLLVIAALARGARRVVAVDLNEAAVRDTVANVRAILGDEAVERLSVRSADWSQLGDVCVDVAIANPPQRPLSLVEGHNDEQLLHTAAGDDGLDAVRTLLDLVRARQLIVTSSSLLPARVDQLVTPAYPSVRRIASVEVEHDPIWAPLAGDEPARVDIWSFERLRLIDVKGEGIGDEIEVPDAETSALQAAGSTVEVSS